MAEPAPDKIEPDLSIVVPVAEPDAGLLPAFLDSVKATLDFVQAEILVVDLTGGALAGRLAKDHPAIMVYERSTAESPGQACQQALRLATGRYLSLWRPDVTLRPDCPRLLLDFLDDTPEAGIAGPRVFSPLGAIRRSAGVMPATLGLLAMHLGLGQARRIIPHPAEMFLFAPEFVTPAEVDWLKSGCLVIRRETIAEIGWPDPALAGEYAALDLCCRARRAGWHNHYVPAAAIVARDSPELTASWPDCLRYLLKKWRMLFLD